MEKETNNNESGNKQLLWWGVVLVVALIAVFGLSGNNSDQDTMSEDQKEQTQNKERL